MITSKAALEKAARFRLPGYLEEALTIGKVLENGDYEFTEEQTAQLAKYRIEQKLPSRWEMVKNLAQAAKDAIASGLDVRNETETERVLTICSECPFLNREEIRCGVCGCYLKYKVQLEAWHCPKGKW